VQSDGFFDHALGTSAGSLSPRTRWRDLAEYEFTLPPRDEQQRIAEILWAADEGVDRHQVVVEALLSAGSILFESYLKEYQVTNASLNNAITNIVAGTSPVCSSQPAAPNTYGVLKVSAVGEQGFVEMENKALLNPAHFIPSLEVKPGFLLVTRANALLSGVGRACIVEWTRPGLMLSDKTLRLIVDEDKARPRFLLQALRSRACRKYIESALSGTEAKNISQERLRAAPIPLPSLDIQQKIDQFLEGHDQATATAEAHVSHSRQVKKQLIQQLLSSQS